MNNWKLRSTITGQNGMDFVEVNGHISSFDDPEDVLINFIPFGDKFAAPIRSAASADLGPVSNQVPGICNGTFTHTGSGFGNVAATTLSGEGSGAFFRYEFIADGTLSTITANTGGTGYKVGDKLRITTSVDHGSQVIEFRLVDGSNSVIYSAHLVHDQGVLPYAVHKVKITESTDHTIQVLDYRSSQVFPRPQDKLLDKYPDAAAAYGLRLLRSAYLGPAIRVRKNVTGAPEKDIFFDSQGNLDTKTLLDFAGDETLLVKIFHDQSGNGNDASQTTSASMPKIVDAGTLVTVNGKPALEFDGSDDTFDTDASDLYGQDRLDAYFHIQSDDNSHIMFSQSTSGSGWSWVNTKNSGSTSLLTNYGGSGNLYVNGVDSHLVPGTDTRDDVHRVVIEDGASHSNGAIVVHENQYTNAWTDFKISAYGGLLFDGKMTEMVLYNTDQSANRENIEKDMALHSGAYQVEDAPLLDAYGGAHAAYSLRKLNSDYTGAAIRVTRNSDNTEQDIGFDSDGNLDIAATDAFYDGSNMQIKTWYDQSGNGNDTTQSTGSAQPLLYNNVGLLKIDGRPGARFVGNDGMPFDNTGLDIGNLSAFMVAKSQVTTGDRMGVALSYSVNNKRWYLPYLSGGNFKYGYASSVAAAETTANTNNNLHSMIAGATQTDMEAFLNGTSVGTATLGTGISNPASNPMGIGFADNAYRWDGFIQELIVYSSDQSERRLGIERNISNHYEL